MPAWQVYSKVFWNSRLKDKVQARYEDKYLRKYPDIPCTSIPFAPIKYQNKLLRIMWEKESKSVKAEIEKARRTMQSGDGDSDDGDDELDEDERRRRKQAQEYQK